MAMQQIASVAVKVTAHWRTGAPTAVAFEGIVRKVTKVLALRREYGAYRAARRRGRERPTHPLGAGDRRRRPRPLLLAPQWCLEH